MRPVITATARTEIRITRCITAEYRNRNFTGKTPDTIARRLFGRAAYAQPSPDPNNRGQGQILRDDRHGTHVLADYVQH